MKENSVVLFFLFAFLTKSITSDIISFNISTISTLCYLESIFSCKSIHQESVFNSIDLTSQYSLMAISGYISEQPEQLEFTERVAIAFKDEYINCKVITDNIRISNITFKFTFYNIDDITKVHYLKPTIPLAFKFQNESFSFTHNLLHNKKIQTSQFALDYFHKQIHFGGVPFDIINGKYSYKMKVNEQYNTWGLNLKYVYIGNLYNYTFLYNNHNQYSFFDSINEEINVPEEFIDFIKNVWLKSYIEKNICFYFENRKIKKFECNCSITKSLPSRFYFVFDKREISLPIQVLFENISLQNEKIQKCKLKLINYQRGDGKMNNYWSFGNIFLRNFITIFHYDEKTI